MVIMDIYVHKLQNLFFPMRIVYREKVWICTEEKGMYESILDMQDVLSSTRLGVWRKARELNQDRI